MQDYEQEGQASNSADEVNAVTRLIRGGSASDIAEEFKTTPEMIVEWHSKFMAAGRRALEIGRESRPQVVPPSVSSSIVATRVTPLPRVPSPEQDPTIHFEAIQAPIIATVDEFISGENDLVPIARAILAGEFLNQIKGALHVVGGELEQQLGPDSKKGLDKALAQGGKRLLKSTSAATKRMRGQCKRYLKSSESGATGAVVDRAVGRLSLGGGLLYAIADIANTESSVIEQGLQTEDSLEKAIECLRQELHASVGRLYVEVAGVFGWAPLVDVQQAYSDHEKAIGHAAESYDQGRPDEAITYSVEAIRARSADPYGWTIAGFAMMMKGDLEGAGRAFSLVAKPLRDDDLEPLLVAGRAELSLRNGDPRAALDLIEGQGAACGAEAMVEVQKVRASALLALGERESAIQALTDLVVEDGDALDQVLSEETIVADLSEEEVSALKLAAESRVAVYLRRRAADLGGTLFQDFTRWPTKKREAARASYVSTRKSESVIVAHDSTTFGGGKEGVAFTDKALYWKELLSSPGSIEYSLISSLAHDDDSLSVNGNQVFEGEHELIVFVFEALANICRLSTSEK